MPKNVSQSKDVKKWPTDTNFQTPVSTGRRVEMASANAAQCFLPHIRLLSIFQSHLFHLLQVLSSRTILKNCCLVKS